MFNLPLRPVFAGFVDAKGNARGRPASSAVDRTGALLDADDVGNLIGRITATELETPTTAYVRHRTERSRANRYCLA